MRSTHSNYSEAFFTPGQIYVASCLGSPLAAAWFVARNHRALQHPEQVSHVVWLGVVATLMVGAIALALPDTMPRAVWPCLYSVGSYFYAWRIFGADLAHHLAAAGRRGAWWRVVLISFGFFFVLFGVLLALAVAFPGLLGDESQPTP